MSPMRRDEELSKDRFDAYLRSKVPSAQIMWTEGNQNEPPDFYLKVDSEDFVVEITTIDEQVKTPRKQVPARTIDKSAEDLVRQIETEARIRNILVYSYYIAFQSTNVDFYGVRNVISDRILAFIDSTKHTATQEKYEVNIDYQSYCFVFKLALKVPKVRVGTYPFNVTSETQENRTFKRLLETIVRRKAKILSALCNKRILIIIGLYPFVEPRIYREHITTLSEMEGFHTIFLIHPESGDVVLHTINPAWA